MPFPTALIQELHLRHPAKTYRELCSMASRRYLDGKRAMAKADAEFKAKQAAQRKSLPARRYWWEETETN